jgi:hypothetical protein
LYIGFLRRTVKKRPHPPNTDATNKTGIDILNIPPCRNRYRFIRNRYKYSCRNTLKSVILHILR